jgi:hypothetical protein
MNLQELHESADDDFDPTDTPKWYIVRKKDDAVSAGPYDSQRAAVADTKRLQWYDASKYDIAEGVVDGDFEGGYDKFKDL